MKELKIIKWATFIFVIFFLTWSSIGGAFQEDYKPIEDIKTTVEYRDKKLELEDAEIIGKFWNDKGHFIVVYNGITKAPELLKVDFSEWKYMRIGELY